MKKDINVLLLWIVVLSMSCSTKNQDNQGQADAVAVSTTSIREWAVPWEDTRPRDPFVAPDGKIWFCGQAGNYIARLDTATGEFKRYELEENTHPHNLIVAPDGFVWYAGNTNAHIGKLDPKDGSITKYKMPHEDARDPHTLVFNKEGNIWFTVQGGNFIGLLNTTSGEVKLVAATADGSRPYGIKMAPDNRPWVVLFGTNKIATVDPTSFGLTEIELPNTDSRPRRLEITSAGQIYYGDYSRGYVGHYDPVTKAFEEWAMPGGEKSQPYGTAIDSRDRIWLVESGTKPNRLVGFDPSSKSFFSNTDVPSGGETVRHMYYHVATQEIWFGTDTNYIGKASVAL